MSRLSVILAMAISISAAGCSSRMKLAPGDTAVKNEAIEVSANWIKDKGSKYDIELNIMNLAQKPVIVMLSDMGCNKGTTSGMLKHTFYNTGERTIDFQVGEKKTFRLVCRIGTEVEGDYGITIRKVYENESGDGKEKGKVIAKDLKWSQAKK